MPSPKRAWVSAFLAANASAIGKRVWELRAECDS